MKKLIVLLIIGAIGWQAYGKYQQRAMQALVDDTPVVEQRAAQITPLTETTSPLIETSVANNNYRCDGRIHCSQMTSCAEATWFLRNCPGTKMDGDNDGVPCEQQFCSQ